jgi:hypothetical protein
MEMTIIMLLTILTSQSEVALKAFDGECYNSGEPCHLLNDLENKVRQEWDFYFDLMTRWEGMRNK